MLTHKHHTICTIALAFLTISGSIYSSQELRIITDTEDTENSDDDEKNLEISPREIAITAREILPVGNDGEIITHREWYKARCIEEFHMHHYRIRRANQRLLSTVEHGTIEDEIISEIQCALDERANIDTTDDHGNAALHLATKKGNARVVEYLIKQNANIDRTNHKGNTALHTAIKEKSKVVSKLLLFHGADDTITNHERLNAHDIAARIYPVREGMSIVCLLINTKTQMSQPDFDKNKAIEQLFTEDIQEESYDPEDDLEYF